MNIDSEEIQNALDRIYNYSGLAGKISKVDIKDAIEILNKYASILDVDKKEAAYIICA